MILLVHSCNGREWLRGYWERFFNESGWNIPFRWIVGSDVFSDQLIHTLENIEDDYLFYMLDDYFIKFTINFEVYWLWAQYLEADALRLQPNVQHNSLPYRFKNTTGPLLKQAKDSEYKISMNTSIWRREYFIECLTPGLDPWELEKSDCELGDVYFVPKLPFWYIDATRKGALTVEGLKMINNDT